MSFPNKEQRAACWNARDKYWECLSKLQNPTDPQQLEQCKEARRFYEANCSAQWVKHFDRKWNYLQFKTKLEKDDYEIKASKPAK